jgi:hypothetical protein
MFRKLCCASGAAFGLATILALSACGKKEDEPPPPGATPDGKKALSYGQVIRGKVTYKGQPVTYGLVLLFDREAMFKGKSHSLAPVAVGPISETGTYEIPNAPAGFMRAALATDPDKTLAELGMMDIAGAPGMGPGGPKGGAGGDPKTGPPKGLPGVPPGADAKGFPGGPKGADAKGFPGGFKGGPGGFKGPPKGNKANPVVQKLSDEQKKMLKEVYDKFGMPTKSGLVYPVREGEQTWNIELQ